MTTLSDAANHTGTSLRDAIAVANPGDTIQFQAGLSGAIDLNTSQNGQGVLTLSKNVTIDGTGAFITVEGGTTAGSSTNARPFVVNSGVTATLNDLTISNGFDTGGGGTNGGAAIANHGTLTVTNCTFANNLDSGSVQAAGGAIKNVSVASGFAASLTVTNSTFTGNSASGLSGAAGFGGAINNSNVFNGGATATVLDCTFNGNSATGAGYSEGGAIENFEGTLTVTNSTFANNSSPNGGAIAIFAATAKVTNCTIANNTALAGGTVGNGAGINDHSGGGGLTLYNDLLAQNIGEDYGGGAVVAGFNNIIQVDGGSGLSNGVNGNIIGSGVIFVGLDPAGLQYNGGSTQTIAIVNGSQAVNAGNNTLIPGGVTTDQRGIPRISNSAVDIGAYELQPNTAPAGFEVRKASQILTGHLAGITVDPNTGSIYVATDSYGGPGSLSSSFNLYRVTPNSTTYIGTYNFQHEELVHLVWGPDGRIYTADTGGTFWAINPVSGARSFFASTGISLFRYGLAFDPSGNLIFSPEPDFQFYKVNPGGGSTYLGSYNGDNFNSHGDSFGIQPNGDYVVFNDNLGGAYGAPGNANYPDTRRDFQLQTAGHVPGSTYSFQYLTQTDNSYFGEYEGYSNGVIDPVTGDVFDEGGNFGWGSSVIVYTPGNIGPSATSRAFISAIGNGVAGSNSRGSTALAFGPRSDGLPGESLYYTDAYTGSVFEVRTARPTISSLSSTSTTEGSPGSTLTITGTNFDPNATVQFNGTPLAIISRTGTTQIQVTLPASLIAAEGTFNITVTNPTFSGFGAETSTSAPFVVNDAAPVLSLPANVTVEANDAAGAVISLPQATAADYDDPVTITYSAASGLFPLGTTKVAATATNADGTTATGTFTITVLDTTPPTTTASLSGNQGTNGWYTSPVTVNLSASDIVGVATTYYRIGSSGSFSIYNAAQPPVISTDGSATVYFYSVDTSNNSEGVQSIAVNLDQTAPQVSMTGPATNSYTNKNQPTLTATASDATAGVESVQFQISSDGNNWSAVSGTVSQNGNLYSIQVPTALPDGSYQARVVAIDEAGNSTTSTAISFTVDTVPPGITNVTDVPDPFSPNGDGINDSTTISYTLSEASNVTVALSDASSNPVRTLLTSVAQAAGAQSVVWDGKDDSGSVVADGTYTYNVTATDSAGNTTNSVTLANTDHTVTVDNTPPTVSITVEPPDPTNTNLVRFTFAGTDNFTTSTNLVFQYSLDGSNYWTIPSNGNTLSLSGLADGRYTLSVRSVDEAGNISAPTSYSWTVDTTAPKTTAAVSGTQGSAGWYTGPATVTLSADDSNGSVVVSGVDQTYFSVDGKPQQTYTAPFTLSTDGQHAIVYWSVDKAGNEETPHQTLNVNIDQTAPSISGAPTIAANADGWYNRPVTVHFSANDAAPGSGLASVTADTTLTGEGANQSVSGTAVDVAGNSSSTTVSGINIDLTPPATTVTPNFAPNANGWNNTDVTLTFAAADALSGVKATYYTVDGGATQTGTSLTLSQGIHTVEFWSVDRADNEEAHQTITVRIDETAPIISAGRVAGFEANANGWNNGRVAVSYTASDSLSGLPAGTETGGSTFFTEGVGQSQTFTVTDLAGNSASATVSGINIDLTPPIISASATTTDGNPYTPGTWTNQNVTVHYTTSDALSGIASSPPDQVFGEGDNQTATATVSDLAGNSATAGITGIDVDLTKPTVSILSHPDSLTNDTSANFTFSGSDNLSGVDHLEYSLDGSSYTTGNSAGFSDLADGNHIFSVEAIDKAGNVSAPATFSWKIDTSTTTSLSSSKNASIYGDSVTFTATVSNAATTVTGGTVQFEDGGKVLDTEDLDSTGHASFTLDTLNAATHHLTAVFSGSTNGTELFQGSSGKLDQQVNKATPNLSLSLVTATYDGNSHSATATASGVGGASVSGSFNYIYYAQIGTDASGNPIYSNTGSTTAPVNAGSYEEVATFASSDTNYSSGGTAQTTIGIGQADAQATVTAIGGLVYNVSPQTTAQGSWTDVFGNTQTSGFNLSGTVHTDAGTYNGDAWSFHDGSGNYKDASGTVNDSIAKADATVTVTNYSATYDGKAHTASVVVTGVGGESASNSITQTNAGGPNSVSVALSDPNNYSNASSGTATIDIAKANATVTVTNYANNYDAQAHTASVVISGVSSDGILAQKSDTETNAGSYSITASIAGMQNYNDVSGTATIDIGQALATVTITNYSGTYDAQAHTASVQVTGVGGESASNSLTETNAGSYSVSAALSDPNNYSNASSGTATIDIAKANATVTVSNYANTYDAQAHTASVVITGVGGSTDVLAHNSDTETNAGSYSVSASISGLQNYNDVSGTATIDIAKFTPSLSLSSVAATFDSNSHSATATATGVNGTTVSGSFSYVYYVLNSNGSFGTQLSGAPVNPGSYEEVATFSSSDSNYSSGGTVQNTINIADKLGAYLPPVSLNMNLVEGRTVPIKFQLTDANGGAITSTGGITLSISGPNGYSLSITSANGLAYSSGQFQYNWQTPKVAGAYTLSISSGGVAVPGSAKTLSIVAPGSSAAGLETDSSGGTSTAGALLGGEVDVYVDNSNGDLTSDELARVQDAVDAVQTTVAPYGVTIIEVADPTQSNVTLNMDTTTSLGGFADGVLGCTTNGSQVTMVQGWNWYAGADPTQVGSGQYDFETAVMHELGHVLGLGHSSDSSSVMYATLGTGTANRTLVAADLNVPDDGGSCALHAVPIAASSSQSNGQGMIEPSSTSISSSSPMSVTDQLFAELAGILSAARSAYQSESASVSALWQQTDALAMQRLDAWLSMEAGAMGVTKDSLMRDLVFTSSFSDKGV